MLQLAPLLLLISAADPVLPYWLAHSHNDYEHRRPLLDALDHGFCSVEADIFLVDGKLLVAHNRIDLKPERTLEKLYLEPLRSRVKANGGFVYPQRHGVWLLIDVKTEAKATYAALNELLAKYSDILTEVNNGTLERRAVTVVVSGNCDRDAIAKQTRRHAAIDGRPKDFDSDPPNHLIPWISDSWGNHFKWKGDGPMPDDEKKKLRDYVAKANLHKRNLRFWASPESPAVWEVLRATNVALINTDRLAELRSFLSAPVQKK